MPCTDVSVTFLSQPPECVDHAGHQVALVYIKLCMFTPKSQQLVGLRGGRTTYQGQPGLYSEFEARPVLAIYQASFSKNGVRVLFAHGPWLLSTL